MYLFKLVVTTAAVFTAVSAAPIQSPADSLVGRQTTQPIAAPLSANAGVNAANPWINSENTGGLINVDPITVEPLVQSNAGLLDGPVDLSTLDDALGGLLGGL